MIMLTANMKHSSGVRACSFAYCLRVQKVERDMEGAWGAGRERVKPAKRNKC